MGSSKEYTSLPTSDIQKTDSPPPYEEAKSPWFQRHWKLTVFLLTLTSLFVIGFSFHPTFHKKKYGSYVDLGFPHDSQQENVARQDLANYMFYLVDITERHDNEHHSHHPHHHRHHDKHRPHRPDNHMALLDHLPDKSTHQPDHHKPRPEHPHPHHPSEHPHHDRHKHPHHDHHKHPHHDHHKHPHHDHHKHPYHDHQKHPHHDHHKHPYHDHQKHPHHEQQHHGHHHQHEKRQIEEDNEEVYVQKLPTHNRYRPPHRLQQRDNRQQWKQRYQLSPSANTSLHIKTSMMHKSVPGRVTLRQDATGVEQDIIVIYTSSQSAQLTTHTTGHDFYLRAHAAFDDDDDYSIDILLPSTMTTMKELVVEINNGTIVANEALHLSFESVTMATTFGTISIENLLSDRIMLATYSGVISGTFRPTERFSVGAYYGHSNIRLLQATSQQENLNIASSSPHGVSSLSLERDAFEGRFVAQGGKQMPNVDFTSNNQENYDYQAVKSRISGWISNNNKETDLLIIHGHDETNLVFE